MAWQRHGDLGPGRSVLDLGCGTGMLGIAAALLESDVVWGVDCDAAALAVAVDNAAAVADVTTTAMEFVQARVRNLTKAETGGAVTTRIPHAGRGGAGKRGRGGGGRGGKGGRGGGRRGRGGPPPSRSSTAEARQLILSDDDGLPLPSNCVDTVLTNPPFGTKANAGMDLRFLRTATRLARRAVYSFHKTSTRDFIVKQVQEAWGMQIDVLAEMKFEIPQAYKFHQKKSVDVEVDLIRVVIGSSGEDDSDKEEGIVDEGAQEEDFDDGREENDR